MIPTIVISTVTFISIIVSLLFIPRIKIGKIEIHLYWIIALIGAVVLLAFSFAPANEVWKQLTANTKINPLKILILFFSMTFISVLLDEFGLFKYLANVAVKTAKGSQYALFFSFYFLVAILTVFTSNDVIILTFTPFICFFCKRAHINPIPYLVAEFAAANTWSLMLIIGNPTNIFLATSAEIGFVDYVKVMVLPTLCAGLLELGILFLLFMKKLKDKINVDEEDDNEIENKPMLITGINHLGICLVFLIISGYINIEMWIISLICAISLLLATIVIALITKRNWSFIPSGLKRLPYALIPFFLSMFVVVVAFNYQGISKEISNLFGETNIVWIYGYSSLLASNIINNIPMSILFSNLSANLSGTHYYLAVYSSIIGSNIGAFLTPMGALAGIMFTNLLEKHEVKYTFIDFIKYGFIVAIPTITVALAMLLITIKF